MESPRFSVGNGDTKMVMRDGLDTGYFTRNGQIFIKEAVPPIFPWGMMARSKKAVPTLAIW